MAEVIPHWLTKQADLAPNQIAIELDNGNKINFKQLREKSQQFARKLAMLDITEGTHVGILSTNCMEMVIAIHALSYLGAVGVLLNTRLTTNELDYQIDDAHVKLLLTTCELKERALDLQMRTVCDYSEVNDLSEKQVELKKEIHLDDYFTIIYTSGTTGFPKGVIHTYGNHWWSSIGSALNLGLDKNDKWLIPLPIFHVSGLSTMIKSVIYGMPVYLLEKFDEERVHHALMEKKITIISVVTVMVQRLMVLLEDNTYPENLRCMLLGGGPAPKPLLEQAKERQIPVFQSYGMTETSSQIVTLSPSDALRKIGSAGKPLFPAQLKIQEDNDGMGEILVKGPMVTKGYFNNDDANHKSFEDGWLKTGDIGYVDKEGFLYVVDRRKDLIISGGENIYPSEIESVLSGMPQIKEVAVTGKPDEKWGKVPIAFIVKNQEVDADEIISYAQSKLAKYKIPKEVYFVHSLPRNASNKLVRSKLLSLV